MTQPTIIGATIRNNSSSPQIIACNSSTWEWASVTTTDDANATFISDNDGTIPNDSGEDQWMEGSFIFAGTMTTAVDVLLAVGLYNGSSWSVVDEDLAEVVQDTDEAYIREVPYKILVPAGYKIGLMAKTVSGTTDHYAYRYCHFSKSVDGGDASLLSVACTAIGSGSDANSLSISWLPLNPTTTEYAGAVGGYSSAGRIYNTSGETLIVDGFWTCPLYVNSAFARTLYTDTFKNSVQSSLFGITQSAAYNSSDDWSPYFGYYSVELEDGDYVEPYQHFSHATSYTLYSYSFQHSLRART